MHNFYIDQSRIDYIPQNTLQQVKFGKQIVTHKLKTSKMDCNEDNSNKMMDCLNDFHAKKLGCTLPWVRKNGSKCTGKEKFEAFKNLSSQLIYDYEYELIEAGCYIQNCKERTWTIDSVFTLDSNARGKNSSHSTISYSFPHYTKVLVRNEIKLYTFSSFFADVGGYLGLLLGESLVSYVLLGTHWMAKVIKS